MEALHTIPTLETSALAFNKKVSNNNWALMVGHGADTIKKALNFEQAPTTNGNVIADVEKFMEKHRSDSFTMLPGILAFKQGQKAKKAGKTVPLPTAHFPDATPGARVRTFISTLYGQFIDEYLDTYIALSGQSDARNNLVKEIMAAAASRAALSSEFVPAIAVKKRRANALGM